MQPGWYQDPLSRGWLRWWDGQSWTAHQAPAQQSPYPATQYGVLPPNPAADLATEQKWASWGRWAFIAVAVFTLASYIVAAWAGHWFRHTIDNCQAQLDSGYQTCTTTTNSAWFQIGFAPFVLPTLLLALWLFQVAKVARRLGLPARREPGWAFAFFVPIVNLWFPYQVARDTLPPMHPRRSLVGWWWAMYLAQGFVIVPVILVGALASYGAGVVVAIFAAVMPGVVAVLGIRMLDEIHRTHRELLLRLQPSAAGAQYQP
ncbi:MAG TPA: DUF4328 domain-containing protein [Jatrophihabitantaceae bacterium]|nr:DUF4328 domain-containing protein [Jatrophihabitantaceae bacterium]